MRARRNKMQCRTQGGGAPPTASPPPFLSKGKTMWKDRVKRLLASGQTRAGLAAELEVAESSIYNWLAGTNIPDRRSRKRIEEAEYKSRLRYLVTCAACRAEVTITPAQLWQFRFRCGNCRRCNTIIMHRNKKPRCISVDNHGSMVEFALREQA